MERPWKAVWNAIDLASVCSVRVTLSPLMTATPVSPSLNIVSQIHIQLQRLWMESLHTMLGNARPASEGSDGTTRLDRVRLGECLRKRLSTAMRSSMESVSLARGASSLMGRPVKSWRLRIVSMGSTPLV